jgi:hypothetical protein
MAGHHKRHELLQPTGHNNKHAVIYGFLSCQGMAHVTSPFPNLNACDRHLWEYTWMLEGPILSSYCKTRQVKWPY